MSHLKTVYPVSDKYSFGQHFLGSIVLLFFRRLNQHVCYTEVHRLQSEKLRASLMDIKQKQNTSEPDSGTESYQKVEEDKLHPSQDVFCHKKEQLNNCIRHHQNTLE